MMAQATGAPRERARERERVLHAVYVFRVDTEVGAVSLGNFLPWTVKKMPAECGFVQLIV